MSAKKSSVYRQIVRSELTHKQEISLTQEITPLSVKTLWPGFEQDFRVSRTPEKNVRNS